MHMTSSTKLMGFVRFKFKLCGDFSLVHMCMDLCIFGMWESAAVWSKVSVCVCHANLLISSSFVLITLLGGSINGLSLGGGE